MGLRQVAQTLVAKRLTGDMTFYGRVSILSRVVSPERINYIYKFWALGGTDITDGEVFYCKDLDKTFMLVSRSPIVIKERERFISGMAFIVNASCTIQSITESSADGFGYKAKSWLSKLVTHCSIFTDALDVNQTGAIPLPRGFYNITISKTTEFIYKVAKGDRIIVNGIDYKVESIDDTRYLGNAYVCRVLEDDRN